MRSPYSDYEVPHSGQLNCFGAVVSCGIVIPEDARHIKTSGFNDTCESMYRWDRTRERLACKEPLKLLK